METHRIDIGPGHVIVALIDGRLHVDVDYYPNDFPMTIAVGEVIKYSREDPEPPKKAWERHYGMFSDEGEAACVKWTQAACEKAWPLATMRVDIVAWVQGSVAGEGHSEAWDTEVRESIHDAIDAYIDERNSRNA